MSENKYIDDAKITVINTINSDFMKNSALHGNHLILKDKVNEIISSTVIEILEDIQKKIGDDLDVEKAADYYKVAYQKINEERKRFRYIITQITQEIK